MEGDLNIADLAKNRWEAMTNSGDTWGNTDRKPFIVPFLDLFPEIEHTVFIAATAAIIGAVRIGANSSVWHNVTIRGDNNYILIGENTNIQDNSCVHIDGRKHPTIIGNDVTIGHSAIIHACEIGDGGFVGMGAIIMDGAVIEPGGMLAAGAMLTPGKRNPSGEIWVGRPAKKMRDLSDDEKLFNQKSAEHYVEVARAHRLGNAGVPFAAHMKKRPLPTCD